MRKKIIFLALHFLIGTVAAATVPASVFLLQIPEYMTVVLCAAFVITFVLCFRTAVTKPGGRIALGVLSLLTILISVLGNYCNPYWNSIYFKNLRGSVSDYSLPADFTLTGAEAVEDLDYAMHYLKKLHPAFYHGIPETVRQRYESVCADLKQAQEISVCALAVKIESVFAVMRDGHSYVKMQPEDAHYMKDIYQFNREHCVLTAVNGITLTDLLEQTKDMYSYETPSWQLVRLKSDLSSMEGLQYVGFSADEGITYTYESENGESRDYHYGPEDFLVYDAYAAYNRIAENDAQEEPFVSYRIDRENDVAVLTLDVCQFDDEYRTCLQEMFTAVRKQEIGNVAVDLRNNGGGDSRVADEFIRYLNVDIWNGTEYEWRLGWFKIPFADNTNENDKYDGLTFDGGVYLLTSANSFSSAMLFAQYIKDNHMGIIIGEAPGNTPNGYGEVSMFRLPHSRLFMQCSTKEFFRIDRNNPEELVEPDIPCESAAAPDQLYEAIKAR